MTEPQHFKTAVT